ncbi:MAG: GNAT family N-acetyltransferase [Paracoccaceae bacterium]|nr:GNAT family N-acetyltransferase [Paracoccaceae bacterium]
MVTLVTPSADWLSGYRDALATGWSPSPVRGVEVAREQAAAIARDPAAFLATLDQPQPGGPPVVLPDGSTVPRLPQITRWITEGATFLGSISLRWQPGTDALPPHVLGHIGYAVLPAHRGRGHATAALALMLAEAAARGLRRVDLTVEPANRASIRVIEKNGGRRVERFDRPASYGGGAALRYAISLAPGG